MTWVESLVVQGPGSALQVSALYTAVVCVSVR
jgi:hypothetical protein